MVPPTRPRIAIPVPAAIDAEYSRRCLPLYLEAVERAGGEAVTVALDGSAAALARSCAAVLLPGSLADVSPTRYGAEVSLECGPPDPAREAADQALLEDAEHAGKPVLGICYGLQSLNVWRGGTLLQHLTAMPVNHAAGPAVAVAHTAEITSGSQLLRLSDAGELQAARGSARLPVNSSHHQAVAAIGEGLRITARCPQDRVIEALETPEENGPWTMAVQWHPERSYDTSASSRALFARLIAEARR